MKNFFLIFAFLLIPTASFACMGPMEQSHVFLNNLPRAAFETDDIALITVLEDSKIKFQQYPVPVNLTVNAKIIHKIKGFNTIDHITIPVPDHTCYQGHDIKTGDNYFIAGTLDEKGIFRGEWKNKDLQKDQINFM